MNYIFNYDFWSSVYVISKWIFSILSFMLLLGIIWLLFKISTFRQVLEVKRGYKEYVKKPESNNLNMEDISIKQLTDSKWQKIISKIENGSEEDFKLTIIEADALIDTVLKIKGIPGENMAERLKSISKVNMPNLNDLWEAHKTRNKISHETEFSLSKKETIKLLKTYKQVLQELSDKE